MTTTAKTAPSPSPDANLTKAQARLGAVQQRDAEVSRQLADAQDEVAKLRNTRADLVKQAAAGKVVDLDGYQFKILEAEAKVEDLLEMRTHVLAPSAEIQADIDAAQALIREQEDAQDLAECESECAALNQTFRTAETQWNALREHIERHRVRTGHHIEWLEVGKQEIRQDGLTWRGGGGTSGPELSLPELGRRRWL